MPQPSPRSGGAPERSRRAGPVRAAAVVVVAFVAMLAAAGLTTGRAPSEPTAIDPALFRPVVPPTAPGGLDAPRSGESPVPVAVEAMPDFRPPELSFAPRPQPELRQAVRVVIKPTPTPKPTPRPTVRSAARVATSGGGGSGSTSSPANRVSGTASWYCLSGVSACHYRYSSGMYAAAGPALRVGDWRGRTVRVCADGNCVSVKLIDWCQCYGTRVIDLYSDAFRRLAPLSQGTVRVTVTW